MSIEKKMNNIRIPFDPCHKLIKPRASVIFLRAHCCIKIYYYGYKILIPNEDFKNC